jgi:hypothetical protein
MTDHPETQAYLVAGELMGPKLTTMPTMREPSGSGAAE